jgi:hypothetical protein
MMPSVRKKDNIIQGIIVMIGMMLGAAGGYILAQGATQAIVVGALLGLVVFGILSGIVLMFVGFFRARRK